MANLIQKKNDDHVVYTQVNRQTKKGWYKILPLSNQHKLCEKVLLDGFDRLPTGFYTNNGYGLTGAGFSILQELSEQFGSKKVELTLSAKNVAKLDGRGRKIKATIPHQALRTINADVAATKRVRNEEVRLQVRGFLGQHFKRQFSHYQDLAPEYTAGTLAEVLRQDKILSRLGTEDREQLEELIPEYLKQIQGTLKAKKKLKVIFETLDAGKKVYLEKVIKEFRNKLKRRVQNEGIWQEFLSENILVLRNTYGEVLEKQSVSLQGKYPDFMLLDPYSYLDIYEIKKPSTNLMKFDSSRKNYYWDVEMAKAISQTENYLHQVQTNSASLMVDIRRNTGIDISVVRPKGYIVAGTREQLTSTKMRDDFRILSESLKNIGVILYDDLFKNLESFVEKMAS